MNLIRQLMKNFSELQFRERAIAVAVGVVILALGGNLVLLKPLQLEIDRLRSLEASNHAAIATVMKDMANVDGQISRGLDPLAKELALRDELLRKIAEGDAFFAQQDATGHQVGSLVRSVLEDTPGIALVSLKTLPSQVFYTPPPPPPPPKATEKAIETASTGLGKVIPGLALNKAEAKAVAPPVALQKTIYKHGVELTVTGKYLQLVSYMEKLQKFPKRVFWSEAKISVPTPPVAMLRVVIYTLSDQPTSPLN
jgi:MSHA biogenesis protein MshJ